MIDGFLQHPYSLERAEIVFLYLALQLFVGALIPFRRGEKPLLFLLFERISRALAAKLNRVNRSASALFARGLLLTLFVGIVSYALMHLAFRAQYLVPPPLLQLVFLSLCVGFWVPYRLVKNGARLLAAKEFEAVAKTILPYAAPVVGKPDAHNLSRRLLEIMFRQQLVFFVAPVVWFLVADVEGLILYTATSATYAALNVQDNRHFAAVVKVLHFVANTFPAFGAWALVLMATLFVSRGRVTRALAVSLQGLRRSPFYMGVLYGAGAGALGVVLGGAGIPDMQAQWIGDESDSAKIEVKDLWRGLLLYFVSFLLFCLSVLILIMTNQSPLL